MEDVQKYAEHVRADVKCGVMKVAFSEVVRACYESAECRLYKDSI